MIRCYRHCRPTWDYRCLDRLCYESKYQEQGQEQEREREKICCHGWSEEAEAFVGHIHTRVGIMTLGIMLARGEERIRCMVHGGCRICSMHRESAYILYSIRDASMRMAADMITPPVSTQELIYRPKH